MQKKLIALAVAGLVSSGAMAQVTLYGVADAFYYQSKGSTDATKISGVNGGGLSGSRLGFNAEEDLGGGMKAVAKFEFGTLAIDGGGGANGMVSTRQSYVGLSSGAAGTFALGRFQTPGYDFAAKYDALGAGVFSPTGILTDAAGVTISGRDASARVDNGLAYISPSFGGFVAKAAYFHKTAAQEAAGADRENGFGISGDFTMGPLSVGAAVHNLKNLGDDPDAKQSETAVGASYDLGVAKVIASFQTRKRDNAAGVKDRDEKFMNVGVQVPVGAGKINAAYGTLKDSVAATETGAKSYGIDYEHSLGKRTTAYVGYVNAKNKNASSNYFTTQVLATGTAAGESVKGFGAGLRLTF